MTLILYNRSHTCSYVIKVLLSLGFRGICSFRDPLEDMMVHMTALNTHCSSLF